METRGGFLPFAILFIMIVGGIKMKWLTNLFKKNNKEQIIAEEDIEETEEKPREYPDEIILEWKEVAPVLNIVRLMAKTESDLATFMLQTRKREREVFTSLQELDDKAQEKINELREENDIPIELEDVEYEFILPEATGKVGKFIKVKNEES